MDIGSSERLAMQNLQIPNTATTRIIPKWLFLSRFSDKNRFTSSRPDAVLVALISAKTKKQHTSNGRGGFFGMAAGNWGRPGAPQQQPPPAIGRSTFPRQHRPKDLSILQRDIYLIIKTKYCEGARPQNQLSAMPEQNKGPCTIFQGASLPSHHLFILLGMGCTIHNNHTLEPFTELGLDSQRAEKLHVHPINQAAELVRTDVEEFYGTRYRSGSFSLFNVGSGFHCLCSFFLYLSATTAHLCLLW